MPVHIFIQGEKFSNTQNIVQWIASRTGWPVVTDSDLIERAENRFGMRAKQLEGALFGRNPITAWSNRSRNRVKAFLKASLAETLHAEAGILWGMTGHLMPKQMPHVLHVLVTADSAHRIQRATRDRNLSAKEARRQIRKTDYRLFQWRHSLLDGDCFDAASYDVVIPTDILDTESAALMILERLEEKANAAPDAVRKALDDFTLAAKVQLALVEKGYDITAFAENGRVMLTVESKVYRFNTMSATLKRLAAEIPDVVDVEVHAGRNFHRTDVYIGYRFEMSSELQLKSDAKRRRNLRQSAITQLPDHIKNRRPAAQSDLGRPLSL